MIRKKNSFLTFCFSLLPGAGQMYMGFMKRGVSLMSTFFLLIFLSTWLRLGPILIALPVIWFFAFFDTFNLRSMPDDEFYAMEDRYLIIPNFAQTAQQLQRKYRTVLALVLIVIGFSILWNNVYDLFSELMPEAMRSVMYRFGYYFPQLLVGFAIIALGLYLISGKKKDLENAETIQQIDDKGGYDL